jgi:hypothetical protein
LLHVFNDFGFLVEEVVDYFMLYGDLGRVVKKSDCVGLAGFDFSLNLLKPTVLLFGLG